MSFLYLHFKSFPNVSITYQNNINKILPKTMIVLINYDTPNSVFHDAILNNVPVFLISPEERINSSLYENNCYGFPHICKNHEELNKYIIKIEDKNFRNSLIQTQKKWCVRIFGNNKFNTIKSLNYIKIKDTKSIFKTFNFKRYLKNFILKVILLFMKKNI